MPMLHLHLYGQTAGKNLIDLPHTINAQNMILRSAHVIHKNNTHGKYNIEVFLPFINGADEIITNDKRGCITIPINQNEKNTHIEYNIRLGSNHIDRVFTAIVYEDGAPLVDQNDFQQIELFFEYETHTNFSHKPH
jgi:hypothetical protein